jgi:hypothetical protein
MLNWKENERKLLWSDVDDVLGFFYRNLEIEINSTFEVGSKTARQNGVEITTWS